MPELYHLHPMAVHFPIALLLLGLLLAFRDARRRAPSELGAWVLWTGTAAAWATLGLGHLAEHTAPHVPMAWETLADHQTLATWTCGVFTLLSVFLLAARRRRWDPLLCARLLAAGWLVGSALLAATARAGGELVFRHGVGVARPGEG